MHPKLCSYNSLFHVKDIYNYKILLYNICICEQHDRDWRTRATRACVQHGFKYEYMHLYDAYRQGLEISATHDKETHKKLIKTVKTA